MWACLLMTATTLSLSLPNIAPRQETVPRRARVTQLPRSIHSDNLCASIL